MRAVAVGILLAMFARAADAEPLHRWKAVPGHKNILVDIASIAPRVILRATHMGALDCCPLADLKKHAIDLA